jgi:DNA-binding response OmpR family regulator
MARIVIMDDEQELAENWADTLQRAGFEAEAADLTIAGVEALAANPPDLLLLDVMAPDDSSAGFTIARKVRATESISKLPIIMLTGVNQAFPIEFSSKDIDDEWMPVQEFFEKPADPEKLIPKIRELLK